MVASVCISVLTHSLNFSWTSPRLGRITRSSSPPSDSNSSLNTILITDSTSSLGEPILIINSYWENLSCQGWIFVLNNLILSTCYFEVFWNRLPTLWSDGYCERTSANNFLHLFQLEKPVSIEAFQLFQNFVTTIHDSLSQHCCMMNHLTPVNA